MWLTQAWDSVTNGGRLVDDFLSQYILVSISTELSHNEPTHWMPLVPCRNSTGAFALYREATFSLWRVYSLANSGPRNTSWTFDLGTLNLNIQYGFIQSILKEHYSITCFFYNMCINFLWLLQQITMSLNGIKKFYSFPVLEAKSPKSRHWQGHAPSEGLPCFFLASGGCQQSLVFPGYSCSIFYLSLSGHLPAVYVGLCVSLLIRISVFKLGPTLIQYDLILTNHICRDPISK